MSPDRLAIEESLRAVPLPSRKFFFSFFFEAQLAGNYVFAEITFADEEGNDENPACHKTGQNVFYFRLLFPKGLTHVRKDFALAQLAGVLVDHVARSLVHGRAVAE